MIPFFRHMFGGLLTDEDSARRFFRGFLFWAAAFGAQLAATGDFSTWTPRQWVTRGVVAGIAGTAGFIRAGASPGPKP